MSGRTVAKAAAIVVGLLVAAFAALSALGNAGFRPWDENPPPTTSSTP